MAIACQEKNSPIDRKMYKKPISVLTHQILTSDPLVPACGFNRERHRLTRPDWRDLRSATTPFIGISVSLQQSAGYSGEAEQTNTKVLEN